MEANPVLVSLSTLELEFGITRLCADFNAATYRKLIMIAEFDRRQGWGNVGFALVRTTRHRSDALVLMAEAFLRDSRVASCTDDRYQVVVHVDSNVLAKEVFDSPDGKPDCYIEKQVALPVETARRLSCSCTNVTALTKAGIDHLFGNRPSIAKPIARRPGIFRV